MFRLALALISLLFSAYSSAADVALTIEEFDGTRNRASLLVMDSTIVPLGTTLRVHSKTGSCHLKIIEQVNDHLIGSTENCDSDVIKPGMKLAYSPKTEWEDVPQREPSTTSTTYTDNELIDEILSRTSVFVGHNFSGQLEGNIDANGTRKNLDGDTALSFGIKGRIYDFTPRLSLAAELGYETPRTLDQETITAGGQTLVQGTQGYSPRLSLWSIAVLGQARLMDKMNGFVGLNLSLPSMSNSPFDVDTDIGFQGGANYQLYPQVYIEGLVKISNMNFTNEFGQKTDVSLAGLEIRGRYAF